jgi:hypothetical protein
MKPTFILSNSAEFVLEQAFDAEEYSLANSLASENGWALLAKFGDWPNRGVDGKRKPVIQRFTRPAAEAIVSKFKSVSGRIRRAVVGNPIFNGHPDSPEYGHLWPDKSSHGSVADMEVRANGLWIKPVLTLTGSRLVEDGNDRLSARWNVRTTGEEENGIPVAEPFQLLSVGLVPVGNIPGPSLINAQTIPPMNAHRDLLVQLLGKLGYPVTAGASDEELTAAAQAAMKECEEDAAENAAVIQLPPADRPLPKRFKALKAGHMVVVAAKTALEGEKTSLANAKAADEGEKTTLENAKVTAERERDGLRGQLAAERKERAMLVANTAVAEGRIKGAARDDLVTSLCNAADFATEAAKLPDKGAALKTASVAAGLGASKGAQESPGAKIQELVNTRMAQGETYLMAFSAVQSDPHNAALFAGMKGPGIKIGKR